MENAFEVLGAKPSDNVVRLEELLEEKELIADDDMPIQEAYHILVNPRKRIMQEILYFGGEVCSDFQAIVLKKRENKPTIGAVAKAFIAFGKWLEQSENSVFEKINADREIGGYPLIDDAASISQYYETLKTESLSQCGSYLDSIKEKDVVAIFNSIVKKNDYNSVFLDELFLKYEEIVNEIILKKKDSCVNTFNEIDALCERFNNGELLPVNLDEKIKQFETQLKEWDYCVQPIQINLQLKGYQHGDSDELAYYFRNKMVELCNNSQKTLEKMIKKLDVSSALKLYQDRPMLAVIEAESVKNKLPQKLSDTVELLDALLYLNELLCSVFAELEVVVEVLNKDEEDLRSLKSTLLQLRDKVQIANDQQSEKERLEEQKKFYIRTVLGALAVVCAIVMLVGFVVENLTVAFAFMFEAAGFGACCIAYPKLESKGAIKWIIILASALAFVGLMQG